MMRVNTKYRVCTIQYRRTRGMGTWIENFNKTPVARYNLGVDDNKNVLQIVTANILPPKGCLCMYLTRKVLQD